MRILAKVGGATLERAAPRRALARSVARAREAGHEVVLVHGGGASIAAWKQRLGLADRKHRGLRVTDAAGAEVVLALLGGVLNRTLVAELELAGVRAAGLSGADGSTVRAARHAPGGVDLGWVGEVGSVDPTLVDALLGAGFVPVIGTTAPGVEREPGSDDPFYNVNADMCAGPLARRLAVDALLFLTDVPGVRGADGAVREELSADECRALEAEGTLAGGMVPKVEAALAALAEHAGATVKIAPAEGEDALVAALAPEVGTRFTTEVTSRG